MSFNLQNFVKQQLADALLKRGSPHPSSINNSVKLPNILSRTNPLSNYITDLMNVISDTNSKYQSPRKQYLSLLYNVIKYIMRNPSSSKELENLYQTFKNFISKRKILIPSQKCDFIGDTFVIKDERKDLKIKVRDVINWLNDNFYIEKIRLSVKSKIKFYVKKLHLFKAELSFNEFNILVAENSIKCFVYFVSRICDSFDKHVPIDQVLQKLPNITVFSYETAEEKYSVETLKKLNAVKLCHKLDFIHLRLIMVHESFDPTMLCHFIEQNSGALTEASIWFQNNPQNIKDSLENALNCIKQKWNGHKLTLIM